MNIYDLNTKEKLDAYGDKFLVVKEGISPSEVTGFNRAVALLDFNTNFRNQTIVLVVGIYELDVDGEPIITKSLKPYEDVIIGSNGTLVDIETMEVLSNEDEKDSNKTYMGEFDAYLALTKQGPIHLWELLKNTITSSSKINPK